MDDGGAGQRDLEQALAGLFGALLDRQRHFFGLAVTQADPARAVADHHECGEREAATALDHLGHTVDVDDPRFTQTVVAAVAGVVELAIARATAAPLAFVAAAGFIAAARLRRAGL